MVIIDDERFQRAGGLLTSDSHDSLVGLLPAFAKLTNRSREVTEVKEEWVVRQISLICSHGQPRQLTPSLAARCQRA